MQGASTEGWRLRRRRREARGRPLRVSIVGDTAVAREVARRLARDRRAEIALSGATPRSAEVAARDLHTAARPVVLLEGASPADAVIVCAPPGAPHGASGPLVRDAALWAARTCPDTVLIIAADEGLTLSRDALRASGLMPWLILSPGVMARAASERSRLARRLGVSASQTNVPVIGSDRDEEAWPLVRYASVVGIPAVELGNVGLDDWHPADPLDGVARLAGAAAALARAVVEDARRVICCGSWLEGAYGIPAGFAAAPVRVGARGAEGALPLRLTLEERSRLMEIALRTA